MTQLVNIQQHYKDKLKEEFFQHIGVENPMPREDFEKLYSKLEIVFERPDEVLLKQHRDPYIRKIKEFIYQGQSDYIVALSESEVTNILFVFDFEALKHVFFMFYLYGEGHMISYVDKIIFFGNLRSCLNSNLSKFEKETQLLWKLNFCAKQNELITDIENSKSLVKSIMKEFDCTKFFDIFLPKKLRIKKQLNRFDNSFFGIYLIPMFIKYPLFFETKKLDCGYYNLFTSMSGTLTKAYIKML